MITVLVACSGDNTGLNFTRSLHMAGDYRVIGLDFHIDDYHSSEADVQYYTSGSTDLVDTINQIALAHRPDLLYVADTGDVLNEVAARRTEILIPTFLPAPSELLTAEDKWQTYEALVARGLPVPYTALATSSVALKDLFERFPAVWLRRRSGSGGRGALSTTQRELAEAWISSQQGWGDFTAAERLSDRTATFSGIWRDGRLLVSQLRERLGWKYSARSPSGVTGVTGSQKTIWDSYLHELSVQAVRAVAPTANGPFGVDYTYDDIGNPRITEVQPARFYSSIYFLTQAGLNLPDLYCRIALNRATKDLHLINPIRSSLYWLKTVDKTPRLLTEAEYLNVHQLGSVEPGSDQTGNAGG